jgi:tRNA-guanine transglycosylase, queuosine-34-forming
MSSIEFNINSKLKGSLARTGMIGTPHGDIKTPAFIVAGTKAAVKAMTVDDITNLNGQSILANTYHLMLQPGADILERAGGLAKFMGYQGPTFTDSGGFQIFSLANTEPGAKAKILKISDSGVTFRSHINGEKLEMNPEISMKAQHQIGADIHMAFDELVTADGDKNEVERAMGQTHRWALRCLDSHKKLNDEHTQRNENLQALYGIVQGGAYNDLRAQSAEFLSRLAFDGFGIGGVFTADGMAEMLKTVNAILPEDKPRHLLGMGAEPIDLFVGAENGCDTFDCVAPTRQARNGALYTMNGRINIRNAKFREDFSPIDNECECHTCLHYTKSYIQHLFRANEILASTLASIHNEYFVVSTVDRIRSSIQDGTFSEYKKCFLKRYYGN